MAAAPARRLAFDWLLAVEERGAYFSELLAAPATERADARDRRLAQEIALGVLRHRTELDFLAAVAARRRRIDVALAARTALRMGLYQLRFLTRVPPPAVVDDSVELAKAAGPRAAAFVNAVLRRAPRTPLAALLAAESDPIRRRDIELSHPGWLLDRWMERFGVAGMRRIAEFNNSIPVAALRMVPSAGREALELELAAAGVEWTPGVIVPGAVRVVHGDVTRLAAYRRGAVAIQDEASQLVALLCEPGGVRRILDSCAAPGGKTALLRSLAPEAQLLALELHRSRARLTRRRLLQEMREKAPMVAVADATRPLPAVVAFDRILVDAPCSGTGTLQRHPEIRWRLRPRDLPRLASVQCAILERAAAHLAPDGRLIYAVCSLEPEEGEEVVAALLTTRADLVVRPVGKALARLEAAGLLVPGAVSSAGGEFLCILPGPTEGFFLAILERTATPKASATTCP